MKIDFESNNSLMPTIIQDNNTLKVLMFAHMNKEAYKATLSSKKVHLFSKEKNRVILHGEDSANYLQLVDIKPDYANNAILLKVNCEGPVCQNGEETCWGEKNQVSKLDSELKFLGKLEALIEERIEFPKERSYISKVIAKGESKIAQKIGEEAVEVVIEAIEKNDKLFLEENADLIFHIIVLIKIKGYKLKDVVDILKKRHKK